MMKSALKILAAAAAALALANSAQAAGTLTVLHTFTEAEGEAPNPLVQSGGTFFGTTLGGNLFSIDTNGGGFANYGGIAIGGEASSGLSLSGSTLYGSLFRDGAGAGEVFSVTTNGTDAVDLLDSNGTNGDTPQFTPLVSGGVLYGITANAFSNFGSVFAMSTNGTGFTNLAVFTNRYTGIPQSGVILAGGTLYGVAAQDDSGSIFSVNTDGSGFTLLHVFTNTDGNGTAPVALPVLVGGTLYGTTSTGGDTTGSGTIYAIGTNGMGFTNLHTFNGTDGSYSIAQLAVSGGTLYGATQSGGSYGTNDILGGEGTLFSINTDGSDFQSLYSFTPIKSDNIATNHDGAGPGSLILIGDVLYGTTSAAGAEGVGTIFAYSLSGGTVGGGSGTLNVTIAGNGTVNDSTINGKTFQSGAKISLTAKPGAGSLFAGWTGSVPSKANPLRFSFVAGESVQANFVTNPFPALAGTYDGLYYPVTGGVAPLGSNAINAPAGITWETAGMIKGLNVSKTGVYSGSLLYKGGAMPFSGVFDPGTQSTETTVKLPAEDGSEITLQMTVTNANGPVVTGVVGRFDFFAPFVAYPGAAAGAAGQYTVLIPEDTENNPPAESPGGTSYLLITTQAGSAKRPQSAAITGVLSDGTAFSQTAPVSASGLVPVFAQLYHGTGLIMGWVNLNTTNLAGNFIDWLNEANTQKNYSEFNNFIDATQLQAGPWTKSPTNYDTLTHLSLSGQTKSVTISSSGAIKGTDITGSVNPNNGSWKVSSGTGVTKVTAEGAIIGGSTNGGAGFILKDSTPAQLLP